MKALSEHSHINFPAALEQVWRSPTNAVAFIIGSNFGSFETVWCWGTVAKQQTDKQTRTSYLGTGVAD